MFNKSAGSSIEFTLIYTIFYMASCNGSGVVLFYMFTARYIFCLLCSMQLKIWSNLGVGQLRNRVSRKHKMP